MTHRNQLLAASALLLAAMLAVYSNFWQNAFHDDDWHTITSNPAIQSIGNIPQFFEDVKTFSVSSPNRSYRPIVTMTLAMDYTLANQFTGDGLNVFWYHLSTFVLFLLQGALLFFFFRKILELIQESNQSAAKHSGGTSSNTVDWIALIATSIYMLHPAEAQTINYVIARSDSLSTFFLLLGLVMYQYFPTKRRFYLYLIPVTIGCLAKPTALMFAPILLVYCILFEQKKSFLNPKWIRWSVIKSAIVPSFILAGILYFFMRQMEAAYYQPGGASLFHYVITQPFVYLHYVTNFFVPIHFSAEWDWKPFGSVLDARCIVGFVFLATMIATMLYASKFEKWRPVSFGIAWFLIALIPTTFVPLNDVLNDHRVFFPYIGLAFAVVWAIYLALWPFLKRVPRPVLLIVLLVILCGFAYQTHERNKVWLTDESLWKEATIESPAYGRGQMIYAQQLMARGSFDTAIIHLTLAIKSMPGYQMLYVYRGTALGETGNVNAAEQDFQKALQLTPKDPDVYYYYAYFLSGQHRLNEAIGELYKCLALSDTLLNARHDLMRLLLAERRVDELKQVATRTLELSADDTLASKCLKITESGDTALTQAPPTTAEGFLVQFLYDYQAGDYIKGIEAAKSAIKLNPNLADAYNDLCCADNQLGRFAEGKAAGEQAVRLDPKYQLARNNLNLSIQGLSKK